MSGYKNGVYSPGQAAILFDIWPEGAEWFVLGGPACANEGQTVYAEHPELKFIAFEPNPEMRRIQQGMNFPGKIHSCGLYNENKLMNLRVPDGRDISCSVCRDFEDAPCEDIPIQVYTLDTLSEKFGPFTNVVLWIDIEHAELQCLQGATKLLEAGQILMINLEVMQPEMLVPIVELLTPHGLKEVKRWNNTLPDKYDIVFKKEQK